jgi:hypothetical protein
VLGEVSELQQREKLADAVPGLRRVPHLDLSVDEIAAPPPHSLSHQKA